jgi:hypothetical protein
VGQGKGPGLSPSTAKKKKGEEISNENLKVAYKNF